ncbi:MAG: hypothetical protein CVV27_17570 [Candidatus Melainabacteria bacterium HGW-Melainabacteria-1]|nr:MAG: hypothetical protein CVV27_17570 [Candidatus Melainabacteria bacterium HGW-Melainabacteria-1]
MLKAMSTSQLHWCFYDAGAIDYHVASPAQIPLGGSQSALCYLARSLARQGHLVTVITATSQPGRYEGVNCLRRQSLDDDFWPNAGFDLLVSLNEFSPLAKLPSPALKLFWNQHNPWVDDIDTLPSQLDQLDAIVYVTHWQQTAYHTTYGLPPAIGHVIGNAVAPCYAPLSADIEDYLGQKPPPLTLAYTSTPFRGLGVLLAIFPALRSLWPQLRLKVFSSLQVYQSSAADEAGQQSLYDECRSLDGVEYLGSIPQPDLARELSRVQILAYPSRYAETSCIAVMEAMAAGCQIVSSDLGALAETCAGHAVLVPHDPDPEVFTLRYFDTLRAAIAHWRWPELLIPNLLDQSNYALTHYNWDQRAHEWDALARRLLSH